MASTDGGSVPSRVGYGEGCPLSSQVGGLGERREFPQRGPPEMHFGVFCKATERSFCTYMTKSGRGTVCISVLLTPNSGETCPRVPP